jgi:hypothetical protein
VLPPDVVGSLILVEAGAPYDGNRLALKELNESNVGVGIWLFVNCKDDMVGDGGSNVQVGRIAYFQRSTAGEDCLDKTENGWGHPQK